MNRVVTAIFDNPGDAAQAIAELQDAGIAPNAISTVGQNGGFLSAGGTEQDTAPDPSTTLTDCKLGEDECAFYESRMASGSMFVAVDTEVDDFDPAAAVAILYSWRGEAAPDLREVA